MAKINFFTISAIFLMIISLLLVSGCKSSPNPGIEDVFNPSSLEAIDKGEITPPDIRNLGPDDELNLSKFFPNK